MPSIDEAVKALIATDRPILFLDTCILLDIIRSTHRCLAKYAEHATELAALASADPPGCSMVVSSIVPQERERPGRDGGDHPAPPQDRGTILALP